MKKSAVVFFITLCIVIAGLLTVSCNSAVKEEFGTVVLDFGGGGTRAVGADGLPLLNNSRILIKGEGSLSGPFSKEFSSAQGVSLSFPVGDEVKLRVSVLTPSARWSSAPVSFTVEAGTNAVGINLSKKISGLNNLLFTQTKGGTAVPLYDLSLSMDGKSITAPQSAMAAHIVARDSKGRVYIGYKANEPGEPQKLIRYTSEGELDGHPAQSAVDFLANDYTTGKMYGASVRHLMEIKEDLGLNPVTSGYETGLFAVDNGRIAGCPDWNDYRLYFSKVGSSSNPNVIDRDMLVGYAKRYGLEDWQAKDLFIRGDYLYILFSSIEESDSYDDDTEPTLGAVLKWKLGTGSDGLPDIVGDPILIGKPAGSLPIENQVLPSSYYAKNFYGAVKVIGFDDENLYIADDGFDAADTPAGARVVKNRNRIGVLNMKTNALSFTDAYPAKWNKEWSEWKGTKTIVWEKANEHAPLNYYQLENAGSALPSTPFASGMSDIFAYDQAGNLYIYNKTSSPPPPVSHKIKKFKLQADGSYDTSGVELNVTGNVSGWIDAIAVDLSTKSLYYIDSNNSLPQNYTIKRMRWTDNFGGAVFDSSYSITVSTNQRYISSLAANKDGVFVAVRATTIAPAEVDKKYKIEVHKYSHDNAASPEKTIQLVFNEPLYQAIQGTDTPPIRKKRVDEAVEALYIKNGVLYGLTTEITSLYPGGTSAPPFSYITGKLWQIGKDTGSFGEISAGENVKKLYGFDIENITSETTGDFAPTRFIAIKPKKLVIASTGYKCLQHADNPEYKPKICEFDLETAAMDVFDKVPYILYKDFDASNYCWK